MATTTNYALTLLEVGQKEKEVTINTNMALVDTALTNTLKYLGDLAADPGAVAATVPIGSTYFNTVSSKLKVLRSKTPVTWSNAA